jgi:hypothetical protein
VSPAAPQAWAKIEYSLPRHPRIVQLTSPTALSLYVLGILYAGEHLTDGAIPDAAVSGLLPPNVSRRGMGPAVQQLVRAGLWTETDQGYMIRDYGDYQTPRSEVEARRRRNQEAGRKGGKASGRASRGEAK